MPGMLVGAFASLLIVALAALILSSFLFRDAPPLRRSASTAAAAWLVCSVGGALMARGPGGDPGIVPLVLLPFAVVVWLAMWRSYSLYWLPDEEPDAPAPAPDPDRWPTIDGGEESYWPDEPAPEPHPNYIVRHWRGECSLPAAYWLNSSLIGGAAIFAVALLVRSMEESGASLRAVATAALCFLAMTVIVWAWGAVGTWRSAQLHEDRGGSGGWAITAQVMVVIGALGMFLQLQTYILQTREYGILAFGGDPLGAPGKVSLSPDGTAIRVEGLLTSGLSDRFRALAADSPRLQTVVVTSPGGRQLEALRIAETIGERRLDTRAEVECMSACTFVLLAGRERAATSDAAIGFHQPSFPGWSANDTRAATAQMTLDYRRAGVSPGFIDRAAVTPAESMWIPSHDELIAANVLTSSELVGGEAPGGGGLEAELQHVAASVNARGPMRLDAFTRLESADAVGPVLTYQHRVAGRIDVATAREMRRTLPAQACREQGVAGAVARGATIVYAYRDTRGRLLFDVPVTRCGP